VESLEAFEAGKVFDAVPPLLQCVEQLVDLHNQETIIFTPEQQQRMRDYHRRLEKIVPEAKQSEVDLPTPDSY
jgi:antitoxin component of MazEF toxin-antitoxin module